MSSVANVTIHASQFPENVRRDLLESLRTRQVNHKFHYDSVKQTQKWLALHQAYSPSRNDADCAATYDRSVRRRRRGPRDAPRVHLIGLGCGGGQKDTRLLKQLAGWAGNSFYTPCDVSTAMVLVARQAALSVVAEKTVFRSCAIWPRRTICPRFSKPLPVSKPPRLITFFGMIPNFEPDSILPKLAAWCGPQITCCFSANLAPGADYAAGVQRILPQYDNALTRDWLMTFLLDLGVERGDGELRFAVEDDPAGQRGLKRVAALFHFSTAAPD